MESNIIVELINTVGFPIAVCIALFWFNKEVLKTQQKLLDDLKDTIRDNTEVLKNLVNKINGGD